jgi:3-deoxy-D-manno-octulosonic-acid transferase
LQGAHRLLLMWLPRQDDEGAALADRLSMTGWRVARYGAGEEPSGGTEIFVVDSMEELGLWLRLAPVTFLGGSLSDGAALDPSHPAQLGSALLSGPAGGPFAATLARLETTGGLRAVARAEALGADLADLLAPDRAAQQAQAAWDVSSDGARVQERVVAAIRDTLRLAEMRGRVATSARSAGPGGAAPQPGRP